MFSHFTRYNESPNSLYHLFSALPSLWEVYFAWKGFTILCLMGNRDFDTNEDLKGNDLLAVGKLDEAIAAYSAAISLDGLNAIYFANRSSAYIRQVSFLRPAPSSYAHM